MQALLKRSANAWRFVLLAIVSAATLSACARFQSPSAQTVMNDAQIERQQAEQKPPVPNNRGVYISLIQTMQEKGMFYASLAHIDAFENQYGVKPDIELLRGDALRNTNQSDAALAVYRTLIGGDAGARAQHGIGLIAAGKGDFATAIDALNHAVQLDPTNVAFLNDLGFAYLDSGQTAQARLPIAKAAELGPGSKKVVANLVLYLLLSGDTVRADEVIVRAKLPETTVDATRQLATQIARRSLAANQARANESNQAAAQSGVVHLASSSASTLDTDADRRGVTESSGGSGRKVRSGTSASVGASSSIDPSSSQVQQQTTSAALAWPSNSMLDRFGSMQ